MSRAMDLVEEQVEDEGLWFRARMVTEEYLQKALRDLHDAVKKDAEEGPADET